MRKSVKNHTKYGVLVEVTGLEPTTSWSLTKRATKLRYTSMLLFLIVDRSATSFSRRCKGNTVSVSRLHESMCNRSVRIAHTRRRRGVQNATLTPNQARYQTALHLNVTVFNCRSVCDLFFSTVQGKHRLGQPIARIYVQSFSSHCAHAPQARCAERNAHP